MRLRVLFFPSGLTNNVRLEPAVLARTLCSRNKIKICHANSMMQPFKILSKPLLLPPAPFATHYAAQRCHPAGVPQLRPPVQQLPAVLGKRQPCWPVTRAEPRGRRRLNPRPDLGTFAPCVAPHAADPAAAFSSKTMQQQHTHEPVGTNVPASLPQLHHKTVDATVAAARAVTDPRPANSRSHKMNTSRQQRACSEKKHIDALLTFLLSLLPCMEAGNNTT